MKRVLLLAMLLLAPSAASAQRELVALSACLRDVPKSQLKTVAAFVQATPTDSASKVILPAADFFAQSVAMRIREMLGDSGSALPPGDSAVAWYSVGGEVHVTVKPNAPVVWRTADWSKAADTIERSSIRLLSRAIADVAAKGESVPWPEGAVGDSLIFGLSFVTPRIIKTGAVVPVKARQPIPAFTIGMARETPVDYKSPPRVLYPEKARQLGIIGGVRLSYLVKADGKIDPESIRQIPNPRIDRLTPDLREAYFDFVRAVMSGLRRATYIPATIGGCPVAQTVENDFSFKIDR